MAPLVIRPALLAPRRPRIDIAARRHVTVTEAAQKLAMADCASRTIIDRLRALYDHYGLPDPDNHRFVRGVPVLGARRIHAGSLWDRGRFLAWLDNGDGGNAAAAPVGHPAPAVGSAATRRRLADNAAALIGGERKRA
ncbi:hypothetical protein [Sphingopyxis sp. SCN 67-31]|uniref:hypothetical protein n=1 Tax=Sphingopyxis sp. SCN 67-31 TaxID=1660142 RepID=UPI00086858F8|nr:hypothetical protein [Sphingopyxis sp. SCN 67-31]ODU29008.1 MAG: hypothetical protein ABS88_10785 [Sphingopyxis sp. SCN 67-31]